RRWPRGSRRRLAGVSSFGFSGTNAHAVLEEAPIAEERSEKDGRSTTVFTLSARTPAALTHLAAKTAEAIKDADAVNLADFAFTAHIGRAGFGERAAVVAAHTDELVEGLQALAADRRRPGVERGRGANQARAKVGFLFTGQGSQYAGMGRELYQQEPVFRD